MALPEYVGPVLAVGGPIALVGVVLRFGPDAFLKLLAGTLAVLGDDKRWQRCLDLLRVVRSRGQLPPLLPSDASRTGGPIARPEGAEVEEAQEAEVEPSLEEHERQGHEKGHDGYERADRG